MTRQDRSGTPFAMAPLDDKVAVAEHLRAVLSSTTSTGENLVSALDWVVASAGR
jgi:hypothetical protein